MADTKTIVATMNEYHAARRDQLAAEMRALDAKHKTAVLQVELAKDTAEAQVALMRAVEHCW